MEYLNNSEQDVIKSNTKELLIHNRKNNPNYTCICLPYEFRKESNYAYSTSFYMDYVIAFHTNPRDFQANGIDLVSDRLLLFEREYLEVLELVSDNDSSSSEFE